MPDVRAAVAQQEEQRQDPQQRAIALVESMKPALERLLAEGRVADRLARIAVTAVRNNPNLALCTPLSLAGALLTSATLGLEPNTPTAECYLVPYKDRRKQTTEAQLIVGYQGYVKLYRQHPQAADIFAEAVYPEDDFVWARGTSPFIDHRPHPEKRGGSEPTHYYAVAILANGATPFVVLTAEEVKVLRGGKVGTSGDIPDPQRWMERKTAIRQLTKLLPKNTRLAQAAQVDEQSGTDLYRAAQAQRVADPALALEPAVDAELPGQGAGVIIEDPPPGGE